MSDQPWNVPRVVPDRIEFEKPHLAPPTVLAADGKTRLYRYRVTGVTYARNRDEAQVNVDCCDIYLDALRLELPAPTFKDGRYTQDVELPDHIHDDDGTVEGCPGCFSDPAPVAP